MKKILIGSIIATGFLFSNQLTYLPLDKILLSEENGGDKPAIEAYSDGIGIYTVGKFQIDNRAMNELVFAHGEEAKKNGESLKEFVLSNGNKEQKELAEKLGNVSKNIIPANGTVCDDNNNLTINDMYLNGICEGILSEGLECDDNNNLTINDKYTNGICKGDYAKSCYDLKYNGPDATIANGTYTIDPDGENNGIEPFNVTCDMYGGGWTKVGYKTNVPVQNRWTSGDAFRYLPSNFSLELSTAQINAIRSVSTTAKQTIIGNCKGVIMYKYNSSYAHAIGFKFHTNIESSTGLQNYTPSSITVSNDNCSINDSTARTTTFTINNLNLPIINVKTDDSGNAAEEFGFTTLTSNPAWFR